MRQLITLDTFRSQGLSRAAIRWGERDGRWRRITRGVYGEGSADPTELQRAAAAVLACGGVASGRLAGVLFDLDGVQLGGTDVTVPSGSSNRRRGTRRRDLPGERLTRVGQIPCTDGLQTIVDLASELSDLEWEQALESALRKRLTSVVAIEQVLPECPRGTTRIRRVLGLRPPAAPPTESLLETLMIQLARNIPGLPAPSRQVNVFDADGRFVARVDLAWPELGLFIELDGQHHKGQPVYDARRESAVVAATGWLCGRFTWREVFSLPVVTTRRLAAIVDQARRRPLPA